MHVCLPQTQNICIVQTTVIFFYEFQVDFEDTDLIITEPMYNFTTVQESMAEILFEEYSFNSVFKCNCECSSRVKYYVSVLVWPSQVGYVILFAYHIGHPNYTT